MKIKKKVSIVILLIVYLYLVTLFNKVIREEVNKKANTIATEQIENYKDSVSIFKYKDSVSKFKYKYKYNYFLLNRKVFWEIRLVYLNIIIS